MDHIVCLEKREMKREGEMTEGVVEEIEETTEEEIANAQMTETNEEIEVIEVIVVVKTKTDILNEDKEMSGLLVMKKGKDMEMTEMKEECIKKVKNDKFRSKRREISKI